MEHANKELKIYRNRKSENFFSYADNGNDFKESIYPTLNGVAVSVWYVSSTPVILHARLNNQLQCMQINKTIGNEEK